MKIELMESPKHDESILRYQPFAFTLEQLRDLHAIIERFNKKPTLSYFASIQKPNHLLSPIQFPKGNNVH